MANALLLKAGRERIDLRSLTYTPIESLEELRAAAQLAIQVEFTTIPAYLSALYSIADTDDFAYQALRSVVVEEMFHLNQAANILVGIGGVPVMTGAAVPVYPTYLPSANTDLTPYVGLFQASTSVFRNVFMAIETPAPWTAPPQGQNYQTIGQLYKALWDGIVFCVKKYGEAAVFEQQSGTEQRNDIYLGKFGGRAIVVDSLESAKLAINQIVEQGEGAVDPTHALVAEQPYGAYQHYGMRTDGTYGPIMGTPYELSHYYKFLKVADAPSFPPTRPTISNPRLSDFGNAVAVATARAFNTCYSVVLNSLQQSFTTAGGGSDVYFKITLPLMHNQLPVLALQLMQTPAFSDGDAAVGPNAAPTFEYDAAANFGTFLAELAALKQMAQGQAAAQLALAVGAPPAVTAPPPLPAGLERIIANAAELKRLSDAAGYAL